MKPQVPTTRKPSGPSARTAWPFMSAFAALPDSIVAAAQGRPADATACGRGQPQAADVGCPHGNHGPNNFSGEVIRSECQE